MYTRCPHCTTIFQITAEQLRSARGGVPCITCQQPFDAVESLSDDVIGLMARPDTPSELAAEDSEWDTSESGESTADTTEPNEPGIDESELQALELDDLELEGSTADTAGPDESEFDAPEPEALEPDESELDDSATDTAEPDEPDFDESEPEALEPDESELDDSAADTTEQDDELGEPADNESTSLPKIEGLVRAGNRQPIESMEFDAPEQTWTKFFVSSDESAPSQQGAQEPASPPDTQSDDSEPWISDADIGSIEFETGNTSEWHEFLTDLDGAAPLVTADDETQHSTDDPDDPDDPDDLKDEEWIADDQIETPDRAESDDVDLWNYRPENAGAEDELESSAMPLWLSRETLDETREQPQELRSSWSQLTIGAILALVLVGQLIHYNRDALATHATYGTAVRQIYGFFGAPLYPNWSLDAFEITGTEAISGRSNAKALDILANVIVGGREPVGLPLIRVVLRDRWSNPVASRVFDPSEYLRDLAVTNSLIDPGTALPVEVSVADPGAEALGYVIDVCLPHRKTGLECQIAKDPFR